MRKMCPLDVTAYAKEALAAIEAASSTLAAWIGGPPDLEPLCDHVKKKGVSAVAAGSLRALGEGAWWTQERMHAAGFQGVSDPYCRACGPESQVGGTQKLGTLHHRFVECAATASLRLRHKDRHILDVATSLLRESEPLFQQGIPLLVPRQRPPAEVTRWCGGRVPADFTFTRVGFTDGAMRGRAPKRARRAGWSAVLVDENAKVIAGLYGTCSDYIPSAYRAELHGLLNMLRLAMPPLTIWVDNQNVVTGWLRGREWCCASSRAAADLWRMIWDLLDDIGGGIEILKVKGHATEADISTGRITKFLQEGNGHADHNAGQGAVISEEDLPSEMQIKAYMEAKSWYRWLTVIADNWPADVQEKRGDGDQESTVVSQRPPHVLLLHDASPRVLITGGDALTCTACQRTTASQSLCLRRAFASAACLGPLRDRAMARNGEIRAAEERGHTLTVTGCVTWCRRCACYGAKRMHGLAKQCEGEEAGKKRSTGLQRLRQGRHPVTLAVLDANSERCSSLAVDSSASEGWPSPPRPLWRSSLPLEPCAREGWPSPPRP